MDLHQDTNYNVIPLGTVKISPLQRLRYIRGKCPSCHARQWVCLEEGTWICEGCNNEDGPEDGSCNEEFDVEDYNNNCPKNRV
jgi:ribosomal protein L37AE/L43A